MVAALCTPLPHATGATKRGANSDIFAPAMEGRFKTLFSQKCGVALDFARKKNQAAIARRFVALAA